MKTTKKKAKQMLDAIGTADALSKKLQMMAKCNTPQELGAFIWSPKLEEEMGDRSMYRNPFADWITAYVEGRKPAELHVYKTPEEIAELAYPSLCDNKTNMFAELRRHLVLWINNYKFQTQQQALRHS